MEKKITNNINTKKFISIIGIALIIVAIIIALTLYHRDYVSDKNDSSEMLFSKNYENIEDIQSLGAGIVALSNNNVRYMDSKGSLMASNPHSYSNPVMFLSKKNALIYDKGGVNLRLEKNSAISQELTFESEISVAALSSGNYFAYSLNDENGYQSHIYVNENKDTTIFEWGSASDYCINLAFSDNNKNLAVVVMGVDNADLYSKVFLFDIHNKAQIFEVKMKEKVICNIDFIKDDTLAIYTDSGLYKTDSSGNLETLYEYSSDELVKVCCNNKKLNALVIAPFGNIQNSKLLVFDSKYKMLYEHQFDININNITCNDNYITLFTDSSVITYNKEDHMTGEIVIKENCKDLILSGRNIYILTALGIEKFSVTTKKNNTEVTTAENETEKSPDISKEEPTKNAQTDNTTVLADTTIENLTSSALDTTLAEIPPSENAESTSTSNNMPEEVG